MTSFKLFIFIGFLLSQNVWAGGPEVSVENAKRDIKSLKKVVQRYQGSEGIKSQVNKAVFNSFTEETKKSRGEIFFSKGRLKMNIKKPDSYMLLMANDLIWIENKLNAALGGGVQVTKMKATNGLKKSNALLAFLFDDVNVWDKFNVIKSIRSKNKLRLTLKPKANGLMGEVTKIYLFISLKTQAIREIKYWDELENWTEFKFSLIDFEARLKNKFFTYKPPKGVKPTVL